MTNSNFSVKAGEIPLGLLGKTGRKVTKLGLGMAAIGRPSYLNIGHASDMTGHAGVESLEQWAHKILDAAWQAGVRYFDAARSYGLSEKFLASWIQTRGIDPQSLTVGSKWGYVYTGNWQKQAEHHERKFHQLEVLKQQWAETQSILSSALDLYQLHSATFDTGVLENRGILKHFAGLKEKGISIGLSVSGEEQREVIEKALSVKVDGTLIFDTVQATFNVFEQSCAQVLEEARKQGMGVIIKESLANGRLTHRNFLSGDHPPLSRLQAWAQEYETTEDALAIAFVAQQPWVDTVLSGAAAPWQLQSNQQALALPQLSSEVIAGIKSLEQPVAQYWKTRKSLPWN